MADTTGSTTIDQIDDVYYLKSLKQLNALGEPVRYKMVRLLKQPKTCAQLARELGIARAKAHYHLKLLETMELVRFHSSDVSSGITEKFYVVRARMFDFSQLMPIEDDFAPAEVTSQTYGAIATFLATMLDVSREHTLLTPEAVRRGTGLYFNLETVLSPEQFSDVKEKLRAIRAEILEMSREWEAPGADRKGLVPFQITSYLSPRSPLEGDDG